MTYVVYCWEQSPCEKCDEQENGLGGRADCGCLAQVDVCTTESLPAARMLAGRYAKQWCREMTVEDHNGEPVWAS